MNPSSSNNITMINDIKYTTILWMGGLGSREQVLTVLLDGIHSNTESGNVVFLCSRIQQRGW